LPHIVYPIGFDPQPTSVCPLCLAPLGHPAFPYEQAWGGRRFTYRRCTRCGVVAIDPMPTADEQREVFAYANYHAVHYDAARERDHERSLATIERHAPGARRLLDFGCGSGSFLRAARGRGYECAGIEYEGEAIARAAELSGAPVTTLEEAELAGALFDVVRLGDVMVAMRDPRDAIGRLERLVAPGGRFVVETSVDTNPSISYWSTATAKWIGRRLGRDAVAERPPTLVWRTNLATIRAFLTDGLGYGLVHCELVDDGWPLWVPDRPQPGLRGRVKEALGHLAVTISRRGGPLGRRLGNHATLVLDPHGPRPGP
jgi:SAM-dependent methyltransferase